jgi:hypothetical protein
MRKLALGLWFVVLSASGAMAQGQVAVTWNCPKAAIAHSLEAGDEPNHVYSISQVNCTATKGEIGGVKQKAGVGTEFHEVTATADRFHGTFVETLANGDRITYKYEGTATIKAGQFVETTSHKWWSTSGTGKFKGIKSSGTCKGKSNPDGTATFVCPGEYSIAK